MKVCRKCKEEKDESCFYFKPKNLDGLEGRCKDCINQRQREYRQENKEKVSENDRRNYQKNKEHRQNYAREYRIKYPDRTRKTNLKAKYGITPEDFDEMLLKQDGKCAICKRDAEGYYKRFCIDHNHETGKIRGILCDPCNYGIGFYEKHKEKYKKYLEDYDN